jgi:hypothetical protein
MRGEEIMHPIGTVVLIKATITEHDITDEDGLCYGSQFPGTGEQWFGEADIFAVVSEPKAAPFVPTGFQVGDEVLWRGHEKLGSGKIEPCKDPDETGHFNIRFKDGLRYDFAPDELVFAHGLCEKQEPEPKFKIGDKVTHVSGQWGQGEIIRLSEDEFYPHKVKFEGADYPINCKEKNLILVKSEAKASDFKFAIDDQIVWDECPDKICKILERMHGLCNLVYLIQYGDATIWAREDTLHKVTID